MSNHLLRLAALFKGSACRADFYCDVVLCIDRGAYSEIWMRCSSSNDVIKSLSRALDGGLIPLKLGFLDGSYIKAPYIDFSKLGDFLSRSISISGRIEVEYYKPFSEWVTKIPALRINITPHNRRALIELLQAVSTASLFDLGLRLIKPQKVPP